MNETPCWRLEATLIALTVEGEDPVVLTLDGHLPTTTLAPPCADLTDALHDWFHARVGLDPGPTHALTASAADPSTIRYAEVGLLASLASNASGVDRLRVYDLMPALDHRSARSPRPSTLTADELALVGRGLLLLRDLLDRTSVLAPLLAATFTLPALIGRIEALTGEQVHAPNARRRLVESTLIEPVGLRIRTGTGRPAELWRWRHPLTLSLDETK
ncbi:NrtR DNA-binding winged helix domain-containing protein [Acidimicrobium ferrooxidans]|nr:hypothetical protein [Acidimicrobium ferrooxidans]